jgi:hypothetical protein
MIGRRRRDKTEMHEAPRRDLRALCTNEEDAKGALFDVIVGPYRFGGLGLVVEPPVDPSGLRSAP